MLYHPKRYIAVHLCLAAAITLIFSGVAFSWSTTFPEAWNIGMWPLLISLAYFNYAYFVCKNYDRKRDRFKWACCYWVVVAVSCFISATFPTRMDSSIPLGGGFSVLLIAPMAVFMILATVYMPRKQRKLPSCKRLWLLIFWGVLTLGTFIATPFINHAMRSQFSSSNRIYLFIAVQLLFNVFLVFLTVRCKKTLLRPSIGYAVIVGTLLLYLGFTYVTAALVDNGTLTVMPLAYFRDTNITANAYLAVPTVLATILFLENRYESRHIPTTKEFEGNSVI